MTDLRAIAHVNWGTWLARCPRLGCPSAEHFGRDPVTGHVGGLTGATFRCAGCGLTCAATWPPNVDDIEYLLSLRPVPASRNWAPPETVQDLLRDNALHGVAPASIEAEPLLIDGDRVVNLPALPRGERLSIGAA